MLTNCVLQHSAIGRFCHLDLQELEIHRIKVFTAFGGNVNYISLEKLIEDEVLAWYDINWIDWGSDPYRVDYQKVGEHRERILRLAYKNFCACQNRERVERYLQAVENLSEETKKVL